MTWHPQPGNPGNRACFAPSPTKRIVNSMGFNNPGAAAFAATLAQWKQEARWPDHPVGVNLGKSKVTPLEIAAEDYASSFRVLRPHVDFFVVNVSSPNTPNLRQLQDKTALDEILAALQENNDQAPPAIPILVKVAPDLSFEALDEILTAGRPAKTRRHRRHQHHHHPPANRPIRTCNRFTKSPAA